MKKKLLGLSVILFFCAFFFLAKSCSQVITPAYKIARDPTWHPLNLSNKNEDLLAFNDELLSEVAEDMDFNIDLVIVGPQNLLAGLQKQQYDAISSLVMPSNLPKNTFVLSKAFLLLGPVLLVRENSSVTSLAEMQGKTLGVQRGARSVFELITHPDITLQPFDNILYSLDDLEDGRIDGVLINSIAGHLYSTGIFKGRLKVVTPPLTDEGLRLIALRNTPGEKLIELFNQGFLDLKENGSYQKLIEKWGLCQTIDCRD